MTHSYITRRIHVRVCRTQLQLVWYSFIRVKTHSYETWLVDLRHNTFIYDMTPKCLFLPPTIVASLKCTHTSYDVLIWDMTHSYETRLTHISHDSYMSVFAAHNCNQSETHSCKLWLIDMRHDSFIWDTTHSYTTWLMQVRVCPAHNCSKSQFKFSNISLIVIRHMNSSAELTFENVYQ